MLDSSQDDYRRPADTWSEDSTKKMRMPAREWQRRPFFRQAGLVGFRQAGLVGLSPDVTARISLTGPPRLREISRFRC
jgi:hypothetical protein